MMLLHKKTQASRLPRHCARRALTFGVLILLGVLLVGFGRQSNVSAATPINSPSQHAEAGNDQKNADQVKAIVDDVLLKEAEIQGNISDEASSRLISTFGGYYYEGDHLVILVTDDVFAGTLEHALASIEPDFYTIRIVPHSLRELSAEVEKAFEYYQAKEASIDIATNAIVLGFDSQTVDSMTRTRNYPSSWKGIPVYVEESTVHEVVPAVQGNRNIASLKTQTVPNVRAFDYNYEGVHDASGYELWGGDGIGSASNVLCSMTINGSWNGIPSILTAGHCVNTTNSLYYYDTAGTRRMFLGNQVLAREDAWNGIGSADYAVVRLSNGRQTNKVLTGVNPVTHETIRSVIRDPLDIPYGRKVWRYGNKTKVKSRHTITRHRIIQLERGSMWVVDLSHDTGYGKPTELGDSGGPVWIQYEYNYLVGLTSGIAGTQSTLVYPMFDFVKKTNDQFSFRTSP